MKSSGLRILVLLGLLAAPALLAIGSQALAARPGPPELPARTPIPVGYAPTAPSSMDPAASSPAPGEPPPGAPPTQQGGEHDDPED